MFRRFLSAAAAVVALSWASFAQPPGPPALKTGSKAEPKAASTTTSKTDPAIFELRTHDDTVMKVVLLEPSVSLITKYGKLSIPASDVRRLEFGFRYPDGMKSKIDKAIEELGAPDFRTREDAEQRLADMGHFAIPSLRRTQKSEDPEVVRRAQAILKLLESKLGEDKEELRDYDVVETPEFTVKGQLELTALKIRTKYFGDATLKLTDIKSFRSIGSASNAEFALEAAKYAKLDQADWLATQIEVSSGQQLEVTATGKIDQWPQGPGQYMSEPGGLPGYTAAGALPDGSQRIGVPGQIVAKIGVKGTPFPVGAAYRGKVNTSGKLYLRISPSPWNCNSTGSYKVTVNATNP